MIPTLIFPKSLGEKICNFLINRLRKDYYGGAWCPKNIIAPGVREWIQIDLKHPYRITRTATQGRYGGGKGREYAEAFKLEYWRPAFGNETDSWRTYRNHSGHTVIMFFNNEVKYEIHIYISESV